MKTTRRQFLKGLLATAAAGAIVPLSLIEPVHGASDLTPQERDAVADVMGLRQKQWAGTCETVHVTFTEEDILWRWSSDVGFHNLKLPSEHPNCRCVYVPSTGETLTVEGQLASAYSLDNFGISSPDVRDRIDFLWATEGLDRPSAWRQTIAEMTGEALQREAEAINQEWEHEFLHGTGKGQLIGLLKLDQDADSHPLFDRGLYEYGT